MFNCLTQWKGIASYLGFPVSRYEAPLTSTILIPQNRKDKQCTESALEGGCKLDVAGYRVNTGTSIHRIGPDMVWGIFFQSSRDSLSHGFRRV